MTLHVNHSPDVYRVPVQLLQALALLTKVIVLDCIKQLTTVKLVLCIGNVY